MGAARVAAIAAAAAVCLSLAAAAQSPAQAPADREEWQPLFNGRDLDGWTVKIRGRELGDNYLDTFSVRDGLLTVSYDGYTDFARQFGHVFYKDSFSHYRLRIEYRFVGERAPNVEDWAHRNSGVMVHSQAPGTMQVGQDFPISLEVQFLGGLSDGRARPTANLCTPGTHVVYNGKLDEGHCFNSRSPTFDGDQWVVVDVLVLGGERMVHYVGGEAVIEYGSPVYGGGVVSGHDPAQKPDGQPITAGWLSLQSEGHPIQFRRVELLNLKGCTDRGAANYKSYYVASDPGSCRR